MFIDSSRCYKCVILMFSEELCDSLPPCTLSLIDSLLQSPFVSEDIFMELLDDLQILSNNCWRILTRAKLQEQEIQEQDDNASSSLSTLFYPLVKLVCRECCRMESRYSLRALQLLRVCGWKAIH